MSGQPDPRPAARVIDRDALRAARLTLDECAACGAPPGGAHHVIPKGEGGDDDPRNIIGLCGSGSSRCHGAFHGSPYLHPRTGERRDRGWVARRIGYYIDDLRPDTIEYVLEKLGPDAGAAYLERVYRLTLA